jgi:hypothetical protein
MTLFDEEPPLTELEEIVEAFDQDQNQDIT